MKPLSSPFTFETATRDPECEFRDSNSVIKVRFANFRDRIDRSSSAPRDKFRFPPRRDSTWISIRVEHRLFDLFVVELELELEFRRLVSSIRARIPEDDRF